MKDFLKKRWDMIVWGIIALMFCWANAGQANARGFLSSVGAYALGFALWTVVAIVGVFLYHFAVGFYKRLVTRAIDEDDILEDHEFTPEWTAAQAWHGINLALGANHEHEDACHEISELRSAGWHVEKAGNERGGFVYLKLIPPTNQE